MTDYKTIIIDQYVLYSNNIEEFEESDNDVFSAPEEPASPHNDPLFMTTKALRTHRLDATTTPPLTEAEDIVVSRPPLVLTIHPLTEEEVMDVTLPAPAIGDGPKPDSWTRAPKSS
jgi:hypothetical protein